MENRLSAEMIGQDTPCFRCGYNLRGLALDGRCPECGEAVEASRAGRRLVASDPRWRSRLRLGAGLHAGGLIGFLVILLYLLYYIHGTGPALIRCYEFMVVAVSLGAAGAWLTTSCEPGGPYFDDACWLRRVIRALALLSWSAMVGYAAIQVREWRGHRAFDHMVLWQNITGIMAFVGSLLLTGLAIWHLSRLAKRMAARRLVFYGRLSAFSSAIMIAVMIGVELLLLYLRVNGPSAQWLGHLLFAVFFLWPATYQLVWRYRVGLASDEEADVGTGAA